MQEGDFHQRNIKSHHTKKTELYCRAIKQYISVKTINRQKRKVLETSIFQLTIIICDLKVSADMKS